MGAPRVTDAAIRRAIVASQQAGIIIGSVTVNNVDGTVRIEVQKPDAVDEDKIDVQTLTPKRWGKG
jgi:hypothetical protein